MFANFINGNKKLKRAITSKPPDFATVAYYYNGPKYEMNDYDNKIAKHYNKYERS